MVLVLGVVADVVQDDFDEAAFDGAAEDAGLQRAAEHLREEGEDVDAHGYYDVVAVATTSRPDGVLQHRHKAGEARYRTARSTARQIDGANARDAQADSDRLLSHSSNDSTRKRGSKSGMIFPELREKP